MNPISTKLRIFQSTQDVIYLPKKILTQFNLKPQDTIPLSLGMHTIPVKVLEKNLQDSIGVTSTIQKKLYIPYPKQILLLKEEDELRIGPLVGILTTDYSGKKFVNSSNQHPFGQFFKHMLVPQSIYPTYYFVFTPEQVNWRNQTVNGIFYGGYNKDNRWKHIRVPLPDVVYNRVPNRQAENMSTVIHFKNNYQRLGGKLFNQGFFNKWDMHKLISSDERIKKYIPETYIGPRVQTLEYMLKKYPLIYLKPAGGSLGLGIYKVKRENGNYLLTYRSKNVNRAIPYKSLASLHHSIFSNGSKERTYLVQQGIYLSKYQDRPVDFRVHLHKNRKNEWKVVAIGAKAAGKGSVTTHIRTGGKLLDANQFIQLKFQSQSSKILENMNHAAVQIAKVVEERLGTPIGELGLDMGVDKTARIWLFEVNSKPGRSIFKHPHLKNASVLSTRYLLEYGITLSGF